MIRKIFKSTIILLLIFVILLTLGVVFTDKGKIAVCFFLDQRLSLLTKKATVISRNDIDNLEILKAISYGEDVYDFKKFLFGDKHYENSHTLWNLAILYDIYGDIKEAEKYFIKSINILESIYGRGSNELTKSYRSLSDFYYKIKEFKKHEHFIALANINSGNLNKPQIKFDPKNFGKNSGDQNEIEDAYKFKNDADILYKQGDPAKAALLYKQSLITMERALGTDHPEVASILNNLAWIYQSLGDYSQAEPLYERSLKIKELAFGPEHPDVALSMNNLAVLHKTLGNYAQARPLYIRSLKIREKNFGPEHPQVAQSLTNLAALYQTLGDYSKAEPLYKRSLEINKKIFGPEHIEVGTILNNLALLYESLGDFAQAEPLFKRSLEIKEKFLGPEHPDVAQSINNLALLYDSLGDYAQAESLYKRSLEIYEKTLGHDHPEVAAISNNLAMLYSSLGDYTQAEPLFKRSLEIREKVFGSEHPDVALSLNNLAGFYRSLGDYTQAESLYKRSLEIRKKAFGTENPYVAGSLSNLAGVFEALGDYTQAESLYKRSLEIYEKTLGPDHPEVATILNNLAAHYDSLGDYVRAEGLYKRSLDTVEKIFGSGHPEVALILNNMASLYRSLGEFSQAEPLYKRSLEIRKNTLGLDHPYVAQSLTNTAKLYVDLNKPEKAYDLFKKGLQIDENLIDQVLGFTTEDRKMKYLITKKSDLHYFISFVNHYFASNFSAIKDAFDAWIRRKGIILETETKFQEALVSSDEPITLETFEKLTETREKLSNLASKMVHRESNNISLEIYRKKIKNLAAEKERLQTKLIQQSPIFSEKQEIGKADSSTIARALPPRSILLEFARIGMYNFKAKGEAKKWNPDHYIVFFLRAGVNAEMRMIDLGEADRIDNAIGRLKQTITTDNNSKEETEISKQLYNMVFAPVKKAIGTSKIIFISPDGNLNLIPFEIFRGPDNRFLIEDYKFNYLSSGRDIVGFGKVESQNKKALLMGDPDFDLSQDRKNSILKRLALIDLEERGDTKRAIGMTGRKFSRLPGTKEEVVAIYTLLGNEYADLYTGREALEEVLIEKRAPRILHLATHGFFKEDSDQSRFVDVQSVGRGVVGFPSQTPIPKKKNSTSINLQDVNPFLRSGIPLAGANRTLEIDDMESCDGIVTAEKILGLRLRGTDMVVLSACDTGIGEVKAGEGVYGLRRAFSQAGARSLVMSMWQVPDRESKDLMIKFYKNLQSGKLDRCEALRQAALEQIQNLKNDDGYTNPYYWGAFVFLGEP